MKKITSGTVFSTRQRDKIIRVFFINPIIDQISDIKRYESEGIYRSRRDNI